MKSNLLHHIKQLSLRLKDLITLLRERGYPSQDSPQTTYCPSPESDESLRRNWRQAIGHRLSAISGLSLNIDKIGNFRVKKDYIFRYIKNRIKFLDMLFLSDKKVKNQIIKDGEKALIEKKSFLEKLYSLEDYSEKKKEKEVFLEKFIQKSTEILSENDIDSICKKSQQLIEIVETFINKNLEFLKKHDQAEIWNATGTIVSLGDILTGLIRIEESHEIIEKIESIKIAYDGVDRIATSIENNIAVIPHKILIRVKNILENIAINTKNNEEYIEYFQDKEKTKFIDHSVAIKRTCISAKYLIEEHIKHRRKKEKEIELYPNKETYDYINKQKMLFNQLSKDELAEYKGQFVCFEDGQIISSGTDKKNVIQKAIERLGYKSLFVKKVE